MKTDTFPNKDFVFFSPGVRGVPFFYFIIFKIKVPITGRYLIGRFSYFWSADV